MVDSNLTEGIAFQIKATRDAQHLTQAQLAELAGMTQNNLSRLEDPDYGKHTLSSLKRIAAALDVALSVRFVPYSQYIDWLSGTPYLDEGLRPEALAVPNFEKEEAAGKIEQNIDYSLPGLLPPSQGCAECATKMLDTFYKIIPEIAEISQHVAPTIRLEASVPSAEDSMGAIEFSTLPTTVNFEFQPQEA